MRGAPEILPFEISVFNILGTKNYKINTFSFQKGEQKKIVKNKKELKRNTQERRDEDGKRKEKKTELEEKLKQ